MNNNGGSGQSLSVRGGFVPRVGIDTLKVRLSEYVIASDCQLFVKRPDVSAGTGKEEQRPIRLWRDDLGRIVEGVKAYHNCCDFQVTVGPVGEPNNPLGVCCWVQTSIPKFEREQNYHPIDSDGTKQALDRLQIKLESIGIRTKLDEAQITRLDTFRNVIAEEPFPCYQPLFTLMSAQRMPKREYGTTFLWNNTQQQICVYDKIQEMRQRDVDTRLYPSNTIRFEHRLLKTKKVRDTLGFGGVGELRDSYPAVLAHFKETIERQLFCHRFADVDRLVASHIEQDLMYFKQRHPRNWVEQYIKANGLRFMSERAGVDVYRHAIAKVAGTDTEADRKKIRRTLKKLEDIQVELALLQPQTGRKRTLGDLYRELHTKVLAA